VKRAKARQKKKSAARRPPDRVKPIPAGYHTVTAYLTVRDVDSAVERAADAASKVLKAPEEDDVPPREMARRAHVTMANTPGAAS
jgi:predicted enzyme related to lactoylglutathione lyase